MDKYLSPDFGREKIYWSGQSYKFCKFCGEIKNLKEFESKNKGLHRRCYCKTCHSEPRFNLSIIWDCSQTYIIYLIRRDIKLKYNTLLKNDEIPINLINLELKNQLLNLNLKTNNHGKENN